jgi:hypothetical protein
MTDMTRTVQTILTVICVAAPVGRAVAEERSLRIEDDRCLVEVEPAHGTITRVLDKTGRLELLAEPRLADNYKFSLPIREATAWQSTEANYILGKDQKLTAHEASDTRLVLDWRGPLTSVIARPFDASVRMTIELTGEAVRFDLRIANRSRHEIGEVYYPMLGGGLGLGGTAGQRRKTELVLPGPLEVKRAMIFHTFANFSWLGVLGAEQFYSYPDTISMPWMDLAHPELKRGVYFAAHDPVARFKVAHLEMSPGTSGPRAEGNWPRPDELNGLPAGVKMCFVHFPYQPAGQDFAAAPVVLRFHDGDWHAAARFYGDWLISEVDLERSRADWMYRMEACQQVGPVPFRQLADWAKAGADAGVRALLLTDWKTGGHNDGIPRFEPDARLGTREDLAEALRRCHELGVRVAVVMNLLPVRQSGDWYRNELHAFVCTDRWGLPGTVTGWAEGSPLTGSFGAGERRVYLDPGHPGVRKMLVEQVRTLAGLGVDGVHLGEFFPRQLDFNPSAGRTPDRAVWEGGLACVDEILKAGREARPGFAVSTDAVWDRVLASSQVCTAEAREDCPLRWAVPTWRPAFTISDEDARPSVNDWLRLGGYLRIVPANGQPMGGPANGLPGYVKTLIALRSALRGALVEGRVDDASGVTVAKPLQLTVYRGREGARTAVIVNPGLEDIETEIGGLDPVRRLVMVWQPVTGGRRIENARVTIPGRQLAVVTEEPVYDRLAFVPKWTPPKRDEKVLFDFTSPGDLEGWKLTGSAFRISSIGPLNPRRTLNSLAAAGETATGTATSPPFTIDGSYGRMEIILQGGWSEKTEGQENLAIRLLDADNQAALQQVLPPGTHELRTTVVDVEPLRGKSIRLQLVDRNTNTSFAWIGVRRVALLRHEEKRAGQ